MDFFKTFKVTSDSSWVRHLMAYISIYEYDRARAYVDGRTFEYIQLWPVISQSQKT